MPAALPLLAAVATAIPVYGTYISMGLAAAWEPTKRPTPLTFSEDFYLWPRLAKLRRHSAIAVVSAHGRHRC